MTAGLYGKSMFTFVRNYQIVFKVAILFCTLTSKEWERLLLHILTSIWCYECPGFRPLWLVSHCCFNLHFPDDIWYGTSFHMLTCHFYVFFANVFFQNSWPFFNSIVCVDVHERCWSVVFMEFFVWFWY